MNFEGKLNSIDNLLELLNNRKEQLEEVIIMYRYKDNNDFVMHKKACVGLCIKENSTLLDDGYIQAHHSILKSQNNS